METLFFLIGIALTVWVCPNHSDLIFGTAIIIVVLSGIADLATRGI